MIIRSRKDPSVIYLTNEDCGFTYDSKKRNVLIHTGTPDSAKRWIVYCMQDEVMDPPTSVCWRAPDGVVWFYRGHYLQQYLNGTERKKTRKTFKQLMEPGEA